MDFRRVAMGFCPTRLKPLGQPFPKDNIGLINYVPAGSPWGVGKLSGSEFWDTALPSEVISLNLNMKINI